jgi:hypothetical protein
MMMTGNLVGFVIGTDGMKYLAGEIFGTWYGTCPRFHQSHTLVDTNLRLAVFCGSMRGVVYRCATHVRVQGGRDAPRNIPKILRPVSANADMKFSNPSLSVRDVLEYNCVEGSPLIVDWFVQTCSMTLHRRLFHSKIARANNQFLFAY